MKSTGFDDRKYVVAQSENILKRVAQFQDKLYIEFGGKLFDDYHAARVLPGFVPGAKIEVMQTLKDKLEIVICISAKDIERSKIRADFGITYDSEALRMIDKLRQMNLIVSSVVITMYENQSRISKFLRQLKEKQVNVYMHKPMKDYPSNVNHIASLKGFGRNTYVKTTKPIVIVTAPGPGSGKLATCLSQLYHEYQNGVKAGYAKFETFPIWNLPLNHLVNVAYEAATSDLEDKNEIDFFHKEKYGIETVNYNRDLEIFPVVLNILKKITGEEIYHSPTDMGINMVKEGIVDDKIVAEAAKQEIIRRYHKMRCDIRTGDAETQDLEKIMRLITDNHIDINERKVIEQALKKEKKTGKHAVAIELNDGNIITGRQTDIMSEGAACIINCLKHLANIADKVKLIPQHIFEAIIDLKKNHYPHNKSLLNISDVLIAISVQSRFDDNAKLALEKLGELQGCEAHSTVMQRDSNISMFRNLQINLTSEPEYDIND